MYSNPSEACIGIAFSEKRFRTTAFVLDSGTIPSL